MEKHKFELIVIPPKIAVYEDKKTGVKTVAFPVNFPSGKNGVVSITHLDKAPWNPIEDIEEIILNYTK